MEKQSAANAFRIFMPIRHRSNLALAADYNPPFPDWQANRGKAVKGLEKDEREQEITFPQKVFPARNCFYAKKNWLAKSFFL